MLPFHRLDTLVGSVGLFRKVGLIAAILTLHGSMSALFAGTPAVINDPDGFTNVRAEKSASSAVVAKVEKGEVFEYEDVAAETPPEWLKVTTKSGKSGYMRSDRIRMHFTMKDLADGGPDDEINLYGKRAGIEYYPMARAAARGEEKEMKLFFGITDTDGAAAEAHCAVMGIVLHLLGDEKFFKFLSKQPADYVTAFQEGFEPVITYWPFEPEAYVKANFPKSAKYLLRPKL